MCRDESRFCCDAAPATDIYTLSLHDALPISPAEHAPLHRRHVLRLVDDDVREGAVVGVEGLPGRAVAVGEGRDPVLGGEGDRKSTRLNSSHVEISYAVFCLKKKKRIGAADEL